MPTVNPKKIKQLNIVSSVLDISTNSKLHIFHSSIFLKLHLMKVLKINIYESKKKSSKREKASKAEKDEFQMWGYCALGLNRVQLYINLWCVLVNQNCSLAQLSTQYMRILFAKIPTVHSYKIDLSRRLLAILYIPNNGSESKSLVSKMADR